MAMSRKEQAAQLFGQIVSSITTGSTDPVTLLMKSFHACGLADWPAQQQWFEYELNGYPQDQAVPWYRHIQGQVTWQVIDTPRLSTVMDLSGPEPPEVITMEWKSALALALTFTQHGFRTHLGNRRQKQSAFEVYHQEQVAYYMPAWFQQIRQMVESEILQFASRAIIALSYGDAVQDIWEGFRQDVDGALSALGLDAHLTRIRDAIASSDAEQWRNAMWACRDVLHALAARLWLDTNPVYASYTVNGNPLGVRDNQSNNRLFAYLHCKGVTGHSRKYVETEIEHIGLTIRALSDLDNKAHDAAPVDHQDALLAVVATYTLLAQFVRRTDLQPVENQETCGVG